jgi:hypothetical protein
MNYGWGEVGFFLALFGFAVPFALLLSRQLKRNPGTLVRLALWILVIRMIDIYWHVEPAFYLSFHLSWLHFTIIGGIGGLWVAYFFHNLRSRPLLALNAPQTLRLLESSHE